MCRAQCVLVVVALYVGVAYSWDLAVSSGDQLIFYTNNGTEQNRVHFKSRNLGGLAYDAVHNRMLYVDKQNNNDTICGYNLSSKENQCFIERSGRNIRSIAYDPAAEKLFFTDAIEKSINMISLKHGYENIVYLLIKVDDRTPDDITVDSCARYIYWSKTEHMQVVDVERAHLDGSGREALNDEFHGLDIISLTSDPQAQKIYYINFARFMVKSFLISADTNGGNKQYYFMKDRSEVKDLTVSKDNLFFITTTIGERYKSVWRYPKNTWGFENAKEISKFYTDGSLGLAANYKIEDQINGIQNCDSLSNLIPTITEAPVFTP